MRILTGQEARDYVRDKLLNRGASIDPKVARTVDAILAAVRKQGDTALLKFAKKFDELGSQPVQVTKKEMSSALHTVSPEFIKAVSAAAANIRQFAEWQKPKEWMRNIQPGVRVGQKVAPIASVGCYVPGGRYPLPSSLLMTVIPAQVAGVRRIAVASPRPAPETLAAATILGVETFYRIGGAQAIAAFAFGTASVARADKIVGPGNSYVAYAKKVVSLECAIDFVAGPTEIVAFADRFTSEGSARFIASDIVAQSEHDPEALPIFITSRTKLAQSVVNEVADLARGNAVAEQSLAANGVALVFDSSKEAVAAANSIGAEHITISRDELSRIDNAGSIFIGDYSPQALGDYCSGPNHTLPTGNMTRYRAGLSVLDFLKIITVQEVSRASLKRIAPTAVLFAEAEGLRAHAESIRVRCK